jgi:hypothetical protein
MTALMGLENTSRMSRNALCKPWHSSAGDWLLS